jgi:hypothetical protein
MLLSRDMFKRLKRQFLRHVGTKFSYETKGSVLMWTYEESVV